MSVITCDAVVRDMDSDAVFAWLKVPDHHRVLLEGAFVRVESVGVGVYELELPLTSRLSHRLCYEYVRWEEEHGGRRVHVRMLGRRVPGMLRYSLSTAQPSSDTLVTLHLDYKPGRALGLLVDRLMLRQALERALQAMMANLAPGLGSE